MKFRSMVKRILLLSPIFSILFFFGDEKKNDNSDISKFEKEIDSKQFSVEINKLKSEYSIDSTNYSGITAKIRNNINNVNKSIHIKDFSNICFYDDEIKVGI